MDSTITTIIFLVVSLICVHPVAISANIIFKTLKENKLISTKVVFLTLLKLFFPLSLIVVSILCGYYLSIKKWDIFGMLLYSSIQLFLILILQGIGMRNKNRIKEIFATEVLDERVLFKMYYKKNSLKRHDFALKLFTISVPVLSLAFITSVFLMMFANLDYLIWFTTPIGALLVAFVFGYTFWRDAQRNKSGVMIYISKKIAKTLKIEIVKDGSDLFDEWIVNQEQKLSDAIFSIISENSKKDSKFFIDIVLSSDLTKVEKKFIINKLN